MFRISKKALVIADALAEFCTLEDVDVDAFKLKHPNFAPADWWGYKCGGCKYGDQLQFTVQPELARKLVQADLCEAWNTWSKGQRLGQFSLMRLCLAVFDPLQLPGPYSPTDQPERPRFADLGIMLDDDEDTCEFHKAVFFLNSDPCWRVRVCKCGKRYVADHPRRQYCSDRCSVLLKTIAKRTHSERRKKQKREWWAKRRSS